MNRTIPRKKAIRPAVILAAILFAAFVVRVIFLVELERSELGDALSLDSQLYYDVALFLLVSHPPLAELNRSVQYSFLGTYYAKHNNEAKAQEAFAEAYRLGPDNIEAMLNYARILGQRGKNVESANMHERAYDRMPRFPRVAIEYGFALERLGRREDAKRLFIEAASSNHPHDRNVACRILAKTAIEESNRDEAIRWVKRVLENEPGDAESAGMLKRLEIAGPPRDSSRRNQ
jgi:tetratricopeptide (TPR) repeat protein